MAGIATKNIVCREITVVLIDARAVHCHVCDTLIFFVAEYDQNWATGSVKNVSRIQFQCKVKLYQMCIKWFYSRQHDAEITHDVILWFHIDKKTAILLIRLREKYNT